jgi:hypothetical protein
MNMRGTDLASTTPTPFSPTLSLQTDKLQSITERWTCLSLLGGGARVRRGGFGTFRRSISAQNACHMDGNGTWVGGCTTWMHPSQARNCATKTRSICPHIVDVPSCFRPSLGQETLNLPRLGGPLDVHRCPHWQTNSKSTLWPCPDLTTNLYTLAHTHKHTHKHTPSNVKFVDTNTCADVYADPYSCGWP